MSDTSGQDGGMRGGGGRDGGSGRGTGLGGDRGGGADGSRSTGGGRGSGAGGGRDTGGGGARARLRRYVSISDVEDGMVILDERKGRYFKLNRSGALILRALLDGLSPADAARALAERYEVSEERAMADVAALTAELSGRKLVVV